MPIKIKVAIIGAGPAGMSAALQLKRYDIDFILFERDPNGSLLKNAWCVENYLGNTASSGLTLLTKFREQLALNAIEPKYETVTNLSFDNQQNIFQLETNKNKYIAEMVFIASGTKPKTLMEIENLAQNLASYVLFEAFPLLTCRKKKILIIGAGDAAFDNALNFAELQNQIYLVNRSTKTNALPKLYAAAMQNKCITYLTDHALQSINSGAETNLTCTFLHNGTTVILHADYLLVAIGRISEKSFYSKELNHEETKLISEQKLYLIGDVANNNFRQISIAIGDGMKAAMQIGVNTMYQ
ncbi:MAG: NAD(P)/FAD-dependent oxidoreductase [Gammaproteobacteria bacterium]|nr:NAD(P)/FAD-dependent oxidoreductase [Gammaproteobacteria bacterium]